MDPRFVIGVEMQELRAICKIVLEVVGKIVRLSLICAGLRVRLWWSRLGEDAELGARGWR